MPSPPSTQPDAVVVGNGVIGLVTALALADRGCRVCLIGETRRGDASSASAGILGALLEDSYGPRTNPVVRQFAIASRERYVGFLQDLTDRSGVPVALNRLGILEIPNDEEDAAGLRRSGLGQWLAPADVRRLEPQLAPGLGAMLLESDGSVDNLGLLEALRTAVECNGDISTIDESVRRIDASPIGVVCTTSEGSKCEAPDVVLAAGAWTPEIEGLPRHVPVSPLRGQMFSIAAPPGADRPRRVLYGHQAYLVPRGDRVLVGATSEHAGFEVATTPGGLDALRRSGAAVWARIGTAPVAASWAGLRPATPDLLPIIGRDPEWPAIVYACGHSRNGILMAPLTGDCVSAIVHGDPLPADVTPFRPDRFPATPATAARAHEMRQPSASEGV